MLGADEDAPCQLAASPVASEDSLRTRQQLQMFCLKNTLKSISTYKYYTSDVFVWDKQ